MKLVYNAGKKNCCEDEEAVSAHNQSSKGTYKKKYVVFCKTRPKQEQEHVL